MHTTSVYGLKLSVLRGERKTALATDYRVRDCSLNTLITEYHYLVPRLATPLMAVQISLEIPSLDELHDDEVARVL